MMGAAMGRALVVEDDEALRVLIRTVLEDEGYEVFEAMDAAAAAAILEHVRISIVLLDSGRRTAAPPVAADTTDAPLLVISAAPNIEEIAARVGAAGFLRKPFELNELVGAVALHRRAPLN